MREDARQRRRTHRFGPDARCLLCGFERPEAFIAIDAAFIRRYKEFFESHHVVGRANDPDLIVPLCRNCHAIITEGYRGAGVSLRPPATVLHRLLAALLSLSVFLPALGDSCATWATQLQQFLEQLDRLCPSWRTIAGV
jgi:hypothetical protein